MENDLERDVLAEEIYQLFCQRLQADWLIELHGSIAIDLAVGKLAEFRRSSPQFIEIATLDPIDFIATLMAGLRLGIPIFVADPQWREREWKQVNSLTARVDITRHRGCIMIPTGGSSGNIKFAIHTWKTLCASVWGFQEFYEVTNINCCCVLPLYHVSGLMQLMRSLLTGGRLFIVDYHHLYDQIDRVDRQFEIDRYFISLVPTQLHKLLILNSSWLQKFNTILLGGAPPSGELLDRSRMARLPLALTYGMTETASQIASLKPHEFLTGNSSCGRILPHAEIRTILASDAEIGAIQIRAKSLMLGYFPDLNTVEYFEPDDLGSIDTRGYLKIGGRNSSKIITGGENVYPIEIVDAIMATKLVGDAWVVGIPDPYWGQAIAALYVEGEIPVSPARLAGAIAGKVSKYKIPKFWLKVAVIPRNAVGKISIPEVTALAEKLATLERD